jgi:hypothetical protein
VPEGLGDAIADPDVRWRRVMDAIFGTLRAAERNALENEIYGVLLSAAHSGKLPVGSGKLSTQRLVSESGNLQNQTWFEMLAESSVDAHSRELVDWAVERLLMFLGEGGTEPFRVVQRFYGLCFLRYKSIIGEMNGRDLAGIMSQGRAQFSAMEKRIFTDPVEWVTGERVKVKGQKSAAASKVYAENARKHKPRQQLDGQAGAGGVDVDLERELKSAKGQRRLRELREAAEAREAAELEEGLGAWLSRKK